MASSPSLLNSVLCGQQERDQDQDRSAMPLLPDAINNSTILSQTTQESLCLHSLHSQR